MQEIKKQIRAGTYAGIVSLKNVSPEAGDSTATPVDHSIPAAIRGCQDDRDTLKKGDIKTRLRENTGLNKWLEFWLDLHAKVPPKPSDIQNLDSKMLKDFAVWRRKKAMAKMEAELEEGSELTDDEEGVSGRTLDLNVQHIARYVCAPGHYH